MCHFRPLGHFSSVSPPVRVILRPMFFVFIFIVIFILFLSAVAEATGAVYIQFYNPITVGVGI
jgi:hypothetical protein